ncbi:DUF1735 and LamG domain-containing protein [Sphingobacterium deserti]|uniref:BT-3987-like N-terminal domain-containing protein n=1 Tax=Sphingobacterium deserti TaxID=1229276 RepID=A0A0B8T6M7_9SPHI|nr:DUF1735 and LamG domain-containing protein [Sphingobacterium deserti]KGE12995.1 hypothetical protein DI53_3212 [Sphingobacterium deserti]
MKINIFHFLTSLVLLGGIASSCKRENPNTASIYLTMAEETTDARLTVDATGGAQVITISSSALADREVSAEIAVDTLLIQAYNERNGTAYKALPDAAYSLSANRVAISPGTNVSNAISFQVHGTEHFRVGEAYMMPITIRNASGMPVIDASKTIYLVVNQVIITRAASLASNYLRVDFSTNNEALRAMRTITMETRVMVNSFATRTPFISSIMGIEEMFLMRFGDVTVAPNVLQSSGINVDRSFTTNTWYHLAVVSDGSQVRIYVDGQLAGSRSGTQTVDLTNMWAGGFHFGYSANGRLLNGAISEARLWSRALSQAEINNGRCGVDPNSPGLIGYWKFNEAEGRTVPDISGNNRHAVATRDIQWVSGVRCE